MAYGNIYITLICLLRELTQERICVRTRASALFCACLLLALKQSLNVRPTHLPAAYLYNSLQLVQTDLYHPIPSTAKDTSNQIPVNIVSRPTPPTGSEGGGGVAKKTLIFFN
jgi:hypothetical protein